QQSPVTPNLYGDTLTITTDAPSDKPHVIPLSQTARGAVLVASTPTSFGAVPIDTTSAPAVLTLTNNGNVAANVALTATGPFGAPSNVVVPAGTSTAVNVTYTPSELGPQNGTVTIAASGPLCAPMPPSIALSGSGSVIVAEVTGGLRHTCARIHNGRIWCWGSN